MMRTLLPTTVTAGLLGGLLLLGGCASQSTLVYEVPNSTIVWPEKPEKPRYRYVGQLTGDENIYSEGKGFWSKVLDFVTGLTRSADERVVLQRPQTGVVDEVRNRIYITDVSRQAVFVFDQLKGSIEIWDQVAKNQGFQAPIGITLADNGEILVVDAEAALVMRLSPEGKLLQMFGEGILKRPTGIARDPRTRHLYVSDTHAHNIKIFDDAGNYLESFGERGQEQGQFNFPTHLAFKDGKLYITDTMNARVQVYSGEGKFLYTFGRRGLYVGNMPRPKGVALDADNNIYVVESYYDHLLIYNNKGEFLLPIGGTGTEIGQFYLPAGVWTDSKNRIYVADMFNGRILILQYLGNS